MSSPPEVLDGEAVEEHGTDVVPAAAVPPSLWRTDDPAEILKRAKETAEALAPVIREAGLVSNISGKDYLQVEAWQTLGQQVGVTPVVVSTRRVSDPDGWEARCEARTLDGRTIGAADSMCLRSEERWKESEDFELRSMAQTRAMSRALASVLRFIPTLAGMAGTPAEEMQGARTMSGPATDGQKEYVLGKGKRQGLLHKAGLSQPELAAIRKWAEKDGKLQKAQASTIIDCLGAKGKGTREQLLKAAGVEPESDLPPPDESGLEQPPEDDAFAFEGDREDG